MCGRRLSLGNYDAWKLHSPDDDRDDEPEEEWEPEFMPVECDDLVPLVPVDAYL